MTADEFLNALRKLLSPVPPPVAPSPAVDEIEGIRAGMKEMRELLRRFGAAIGAAAAAIMTGLGYAQVHEIFPLPANANETRLAALAAASAVAALLGAAWLTGRFFAAQRRIVITSAQDDRDFKLRRRRTFTRAERRLRNAVFSDAAAEYGAATFEALELRGLRLRRIERRLPESDPVRKPVKAEAERIENFVPLVLYRAALKVLEWRAQQAFRGRFTATATLLAIAGVLGLFGLADWSKGQRELISLRKACAEATTAGAANACDPVTPSDQLREAERDATNKVVQARLATVARASECWRLIRDNEVLAAATAEMKQAVFDACFEAKP